ncbi:MAG: DUF1998 domain-containing protein [Pelotomaculum sp.]|nr:DUF1998 domain-containing protein [Pelotomaculum sp.]
MSYTRQLRKKFRSLKRSLTALPAGLSLWLRKYGLKAGNGCLYPTPGHPLGSPAIILFDDVPGGAGHVRRLARKGTFKEVLRASLNRLQRCECGGAEGNASCYGCLRHYRNQFCHDELNRGLAIKFLSEILA